MQVPVGVLGQAVGIAFFPSLVALASTGSKDELRATLNYGLRLMLFISMPATVLLILFRHPVIVILFQHWHFGPQATREVAAALVFYALGISAWCCQALVARAFYSMQDTRTPVWTGTAVTALFFPMNWVLLHAFGGPASLAAHEGLALATTIAATLHVLALLEILRRRVGGLHSARLLRSAGKVGAASTAMGLAAWAAMTWVQAQPPVRALGGTPGAAVLLLAGLAAGTPVFLGTIRLLRAEEAAAAWDLTRRRFARRA